MDETQDRTPSNSDRGALWATILVGVAAYSIVYTRNAVQWTREHRAKEDQ